ncbi:hypothetical protein [Cryptosporangium arvum]|uniref:hypothetical protein n=1 Tax=Cryptosporangium arvum TaxID=80871 RepID=UPI0004B8A46E|nr:hypothetical protein [Cryptosporangium arvum]
MPRTVVPPKPRALRLPEPEARRKAPAVRRVAAGVLMTAVVVGSTAGATLAASIEDSDTVPVVVRPSEATPSASPDRVQDVSLLVYSWPSPSPSSTKSTAVRTTDPDQGVVRRAGTATRIAVVWAVAATVATAGLIAGSMLGRR